jgi:hypothetical protein
MVLLAPLLGDLRARQISLISGLVIIFAITYAFIGWLRATTNCQLLLIGCFWAALTATFEVALGRLVLGYPWERIASDYNLARGGLMPLGLVLLTVVPLLASATRRGRRSH